MDPPRVESIRIAGFIGEQTELDSVVSELRELERKNSLERTVAIGRLILRRFFGGSVAAWRERRRNKNNSVRRLAQHPLCPLSRSGLNQAIGIFVAFEALALDQTFGHIGPSHISAVLHLRPDAQLHWLERAQHEAWGVRELKDQVTRQRRETGERRGRPRTAEKAIGVVALRKVVRLLEQAVSALENSEPAGRDRGELEALAKRVGAAELRLARFIRRPGQSELRYASAGSSNATLKNAG